jgi:hypothetical protein
VPAETTAGLKRLEDVLASESACPKSADDADRLRAELQELVKKHLPPWAEEELLPRLNVVRWGVQAIWTARHNEDVPADRTAEVAEDCKSLLAAAPDGSPATLKALLQGRQNQLSKEAEKHRKQAALTLAEQALEGKADAVSALAALQEWDKDEAAQKVRDKLRGQLAEQEARKKVEVLRSTLAAARKLSSASQQQAGIAKVHDAGFGLLLDLRAETSPREEIAQEVEKLLAECQELSRKLAKQQEDAYAQKVREYQQWALKQLERLGDKPQSWYYDVALSDVNGHLKDFKNATEDRQWTFLRDFPEMKRLIEEKLGVDLSDVNGDSLTPEQQRRIWEKAHNSVLPGWNKDIDKEMAYWATRYAMVKFLLPINTSLLDPPVAQLYQKEFQRAWNKLEGREDQLEVAEQSAVVKKKGLEDPKE